MKPSDLCRETYTKAEAGESPNDRNDRAIRVAAAWCAKPCPYQVLKIRAGWLVLLLLSLMRSPVVPHPKHESCSPLCMLSVCTPRPLSFLCKVTCLTPRPMPRYAARLPAMPIIMLSNDADNRRKAAEAGVAAMTVQVCPSAGPAPGASGESGESISGESISCSTERKQRTASWCAP